MAIEDEIAKRLIPKITNELVWNDITGTVSFMSPGQKDDILQCVKDNRPGEIGTIIIRAMKSVVNDRAYTEASQMMADESLSTSELSRILE